MTKPSNQTVSAWISIARAYNSTFSVVEEALKKAKLPPLSWYDVLLELDRADPDGLRPFELQEKLLLPQYGVSRLIARIEENGFLVRTHCEDDKRGQRLRITQKGKKKRQLMWRVYGDGLQKVIGENVTVEQASQLSEMLKKII